MLKCLIGSTFQCAYLKTVNLKCFKNRNVTPLSIKLQPSIEILSEMVDSQEIYKCYARSKLRDTPIEASQTNNSNLLSSIGSWFGVSYSAKVKIYEYSPSLIVHNPDGVVQLVDLEAKTQVSRIKCLYKFPAKSVVFALALEDIIIMIMIIMMIKYEKMDYCSFFFESPL